jgi:transposase
LLSNRKPLQRRALDIETAIRSTLKAFGLKVGKVSKGGFAPQGRGLLDDRARPRAMTVPLLKARAVLLEAFDRLHPLVLEAVRSDPVCHCFMTIPGVGPLSALTYKTGLDEPHRFAKSKTVGAPLRAHPRTFNSGEIDDDGPIKVR